MAFADVVAKLTEGVENIGDVSEYVKELQSEHERELGIRQAKITTLETDLETRKKTELELKATNYDLLMKTGVSGGEGDPEPEPEPERKGINSLFETKEA